MPAVSKSVNAVVRPVADAQASDPNGEFEVVISKDNRDRDGDQLWADQWGQLPDRLHLDTDHAFLKGESVPYTAGSGVPRITDNGDVVVRGTFAGTPHGQMVRQLVNEGHVWQASATYLEHPTDNGGVERELLNATFCGVPANPQAVVLSSKTTNLTKGPVMALNEVAVRTKTLGLAAELNRVEELHRVGKLTSDAYVKALGKIQTDAEALDVAEANIKTARRYAGSGDSAAQHALSGVRKGGTVVARNLSPADIPGDELRNMFEAARRKMPYRCEIHTTAMGGAGAPPIGTKTAGAPIAEGAPWPSGLFPPVIRPELTQDLRYEFDRFADHIPTITIEAPSIEYLIHTGNTNPAAVVEELGVKADLGMQLDTATAVPVKIAALASTSMEALADFDYFAEWVPRELARAVINVETDQLVLGSGSPGMTGFVATSGVLTRSYSSGTDTSGIDTLLQAVNDIRVGPAYGHADLIALHPSTWDYLRRTKTTTDAFVLNVMDPTAIGNLDNLFGTKVITNTFVPEGTGVVLDTTLAAKYFVRQAMTVDQNMWGDLQWTTNQISWRCEMRSTLAVTRPTAVCIVTGLSSDSGS